MARYLLGVDLGTSACKVVVLDPEVGALGQGRSAYPLHMDHEHWAELDTNEVRQGLHDATEQALGQAGVSGDSLEAVGLTGLVPGLVAVDSNAKPLTPCMVNLDRRAQEEAQRLEAAFGAAVLAMTTGLTAHPKFPAAKILWLRTHQPEVFNQAAMFLQLKDFVITQLTGLPRSDQCTAANTFLYDVSRRNWSGELLSYCGLVPERLPLVVGSTAVVGEVTHHAATWSGLVPGTKVVCGADDTTCAMLASGAYRIGKAYENSGTSSHLAAATDRCMVLTEDDVGKFEYSLALRPDWHTISYIDHATGSMVHWLLDILFKEVAGADPLGQLDKETQSVDVGAGGLTFLPFLEGEGYPHLNPQARGAVFGLSLQHDRGHLLRAALEGIAYWLRSAIEDLHARSVGLDEVILGGGLANSRVLQNIKTNVIGLPTVRMSTTEGAALGAALLAGEGAGVFHSAIAISDRFTHVAERVEPDRLLVEEYSARYATYARLRLIANVGKADSGGLRVVAGGQRS